MMTCFGLAIRLAQGIWLLAAMALVGSSIEAAEQTQAEHGLVFSCSADNSLFTALRKSGRQPLRYASAEEAINAAKPQAVVLILADDYPKQQTAITSECYHKAAEKHLRLFVEFPAMCPGIELGELRSVRWERGVVAANSIELGLPILHILALHDCKFLSTQVSDAALVMARVAGVDTAVYGLPENRFPLLFKADENTFVATTKLSDFVKSRYAPTKDWQTFWSHLLAALDPQGAPYELNVVPIARPAYGKDETLPPDADLSALNQIANWYKQSRLLLNSERKEKIVALLKSDVELIPPPEAYKPGDGSQGILEGYASRILPDGSQLQRTPIRADCQAESAAVLALHAGLTGDESSRHIAVNLLNYLYFDSELHQGERGNPRHPAFGLIAWGAVGSGWRIAYYGDDNARTLLATMVAASALGSDRWDESMLRALAANLRTTGKLGFRGDRIDMPQLEQEGWKAFYEKETINYSPSFEAYSWACFLWAYDKTGNEEYLDKAKTGIQMTMKAYPEGWRWGDHLDRTRMLLALAWLVRVDDTAQHRQWLLRVANDLIKNQQPSGAIPEELSGTSSGHFVVPATNEAYGTGETPLIHSEGDPISDQLYSTNFALIGLREAVAATNDPALKKAEDLLAEYVVRIQVRSEEIPYLDGTWFRGFDFRRWDYWASSGDAGWGVWCAETGWGPAWNGIVLGLRQKQTSLWELTSSSKIKRHMNEVTRLMTENPGKPWIDSAKSQ
jgi:hypothetical protein